MERRLNKLCMDMAEIKQLPFLHNSEIFKTLDASF